jgi:hypothetical protein
MAGQWPWVTRWVPVVPSSLPGSYMCCVRGVGATGVPPSATAAAAPVRWSSRQYPRMPICRVTGPCLWREDGDQAFCEPTAGTAAPLPVKDCSCHLQLGLPVWVLMGTWGANPAAGRNPICKRIFSGAVSEKSRPCHQACSGLRVMRSWQLCCVCWPVTALVTAGPCLCWASAYEPSSHQCAVML